MRRANTYMYKISKQGCTGNISFVKCGGSSPKSPPAPRPVDCKAYQLLPFSSADSLVIIGDISAFCTPWLIPLCPHPPLSNDLRGSSTFSQIKEERSSREGGKQRQTLPKTLCARGMHSQKESQGPLLGQNPTSGFC